ncbi:MAG: response regulator, partial [Mariniphaga sp.]|nr:response regulator [Mariniphaga sp.]
MWKKSVKILFAEDLPTDVELAVREIQKGGIDFNYKVVDTEIEFRKELDEFEPDIVVSDYSMPTFDGMRALKITRAKSEYIPFVVLTGSMNEETAVACMKAGANDYVIKE